MGCVDYIHKDFFNPEDLVAKYCEVNGWRDAFMERIFKASKRADLKTTSIYKNRKHSVKQMLEICISELSYLVRADPDTAEFHRRWETNKENMSWLYKNKMILDDDEENVDAVGTFWELIQSIKKNSGITRDLREKLVWPWTVD